MSDLRPALRPYLEPIPVSLPQLEGEQVFALRDPFKLAQGQIVVPVAGLALLALFDGTRTVAEAQEEFAQRYGAQPPADQVQALLQNLRDAYLLDGPHVTEFVDAFARAEVREPACIGSYPGDPAELREFIHAQYLREGGPGAAPALGATGAPPVRGVISPHIDPHRGGHAYAWAWRAVAEACTAEVFVIFGTSHAGTAPVNGDPEREAARYALTRKTFRTPLGDVPADQEVLDRLVAAYDGPDDLFAGEFHHRSEHSIEFQAIYLAHLFAQKRPLRIVPILCGGLHHLKSVAPSQDEAFSSFHRALRDALAPLPPEKVAFVAAIDLAHVGAQFHQPDATAERLEQVAARDRETLRLAVEERSPDAVHSDLVVDVDLPAPAQRNVCGHAALVGFLQAMHDPAAPVAGELLHYGAWHDGVSAVSFASAVYRDTR